TSRSSTPDTSRPAGATSSWSASATRPRTFRPARNRSAHSGTSGSGNRARSTTKGGRSRPSVLRLDVRSAAVAPAAAASAAPIALAARTLLALRARRRVLRTLDQLLGRHDGAVLVLGQELEADAAALLVDLLHGDVEHVPALDHVLDVADAAGSDVRH